MEAFRETVKEVIMKNENIFGPGNPHPLSQMRTELVWEGKYDEYGRAL